MIAIKFVSNDPAEKGFAAAVRRNVNEYFPGYLR
jgi:hypothetical protein